MKNGFYFSPIKDVRVDEETYAWNAAALIINTGNCRVIRFIQSTK